MTNGTFIPPWKRKVPPPIPPEEEFPQRGAGGEILSPEMFEPLDIGKLFPFARKPEFEVGPKDILPEGGFPGGIQPTGQPEISLAEDFKPIVKGVEFATLPFTEFGIFSREMEKALEREGVVSETITPIQPSPKPIILDKGDEIKQYLPGGAKYEEFRALPLSEQLRHEAPAWALLLLAPSATALRAGLAGRTGVLPTTARGALTPLESIETAQAFVIDKTVGASYRTLMRASLDRMIKQQSALKGVEIPLETQQAFTDAAIRELSPVFLAKESVKSLFRRTKGGFQPTASGVQTADGMAETAVTYMLPKFTATNTAVPNQTLKLADIITSTETQIPPSVQAVQAGRAELVPEQTVNEYAKTLIGQEFATSAVTDPAIARAKGLVDKLTSVTPKGVKFESGKFLTFEKFPPTAEYLAQQGIPTEVPPEAVSRPTEVVTPIAPEMTPEVPTEAIVSPPETAFEVPVSQTAIDQPPTALAVPADKSMTQAGVPPKKPPKDWNKVKTDLWDRYNRFSPEASPSTRPISEMIRGMSRQVEKFVADEFARLNKLGWNSEIDSAMVKASSGKAAEIYRRTMTNVNRAIGGNSDLLRFVDDYLILRHQLEVMRATGRKTVSISKGGKTSKFTPKQVQLLIAQMKNIIGPESYEQVKQAASFVPETYHNILRESSEITPAIAEELIAKYPWYNPILYETEGAEAVINLSKKLTPSQVKSLTNFDIDKQVQSPLSVLASTIRRRVQANAKNEARKSIANDAVGSTEWGGLVQIVDKKPKGAFIDFFENGQRKYLELGKGTEWIAEDIALFETQPKNVISRIAKGLNNIPRAVFTTYNPSFIVTNTLFDTLVAYFKEGITPLQIAQSFGNTVKDIFVEDALVNQFRTEGADVGGFFRGEKDITAEFIKAGKEGNIIIKNPRDLKRFANPFQIVKELGHAGENAPRLATYRKAIKQGATPKEAALRARRVSVDFARMGTASKFLNDFFLFFNAGTQGFLLPGRALRDDPRSWWRLALLMSAVTGLTAYNLSYDEYKDVPDNIKYGTVHFMLPSDEYNKFGQKVPKYITVTPNTREFALFFGPLVYTMEVLSGQAPEATDDFFGSIRRAFGSWYPRWSPLSMITQTGGFEAPTQILQTITQIADNHDNFRNRPIVSDELLVLPPKEQYDEFTSEMAIYIGQALNISPKKVDFFVNNMSGTLGRDILDVANRGIKQIDAEQADTRIVVLVDELRDIPNQVPPEKITLARKDFLDKLSVEDRDLVLSMESLPEDRIPVITSMIQRLFRERGGQVYQTARDIAGEEEREFPQTSDEFLAEEAVQNAQNFLNGSITKFDYDNQRKRYRAVASGKSSAEWRQAMLEGAVSRADIDPFLAEGFERAEEFRALSAYHEVRNKHIDEAGGVFDSDTWDKIQELTLLEMQKQYSEVAIQFALVHKDDWILDLPEPARQVELDRAAGIEDETWWDAYRTKTTKQPRITPREPVGAGGERLVPPWKR